MTPTLRELPLPLRALFSSFLILIGFGYVAALLLLFLTDVDPHQRMGMGLVAGIQMKYHGNRGDSRLEAALRGTMASQLGDAERDRVLSWVRSGAPAAGYEEVKPIFERSCVRCHSARSGLGPAPLDSLDNVRKLAQIDTGPTIAELARVSHVHLFGISIIFLLTGTIFALSDTPGWLRVTLLVAPYAGIAADIGSWWLTRAIPVFGIVVVIGGAVISLSLAGQILISLWQMWLSSRGARGTVASEARGRVGGGS